MAWGSIDWRVEVHSNTEDLYLVCGSERQAGHVYAERILATNDGTVSLWLGEDLRRTCYVNGEALREEIA